MGRVEEEQENMGQTMSSVRTSSALGRGVAAPLQIC